ncbi:MAG TPA: alpha/beta fold hydrolase [Blastocatellia bacterium]|nr:alpha/beta fold hydrolase [Blastocatellia bacterium]
MSTTSRTLTDGVPGKSFKDIQIAQDRPSWLSSAEFPFTSRWTEIDGARMHYVDEGNGPVLLMIPGTPMWSFMYRHTIKTLSKQFRCIAVDQPGLGLSQAPLIKNRAFSRNAELFQGFVKVLDLRDITLVMHATGGPPALEMAVRERNRIRGLVVTNSFAWPLTEPKLRFFVRMISSRLFAFLNINFNFLPVITSKKGRSTGPFSAEEKAAILGPYQDRRVREHLQNVAFSLRTEEGFLQNLEQRLSALCHIPTLFLYGTNDNGYKAGLLEHWKRLLPNHKIALLEKSRHFAIEDEPERYTSELKLWLQEQIG